MGNELTHLSLFSGIGGIDLAAEWAGFETVAFCEQNKFCQQVLTKHWPGVPIYDDIRHVSAKSLAERGIKPGTVKLITGGFPCQPFSDAGEKRGKDDDRYLWPEMFGAVSDIHPDWVVGENVDGIINMALDDCISDLETQDYEVQTFVLPACGVGAYHRRNRVFIVAHSNRNISGSWRTEPEGQFRKAGSTDGGYEGFTTNPDSGASRTFGDKGTDQTRANKTFNNSGAVAAITDPEHERCEYRGDNETGRRDNPNSQWATTAGSGRNQRRLQPDISPVSSNWYVSHSASEGLPDWAGGTVGQPRPLTEFERSGSDGTIREVEYDFRGVPHGVSDGAYRYSEEGIGMDRDSLIINALAEGRIETDPATGKIFSRCIRGRQGEKIELPGANVNGYVCHRLYYAGVKKQVRAHRIVWIAANGVIPEGLMIDHINRDKSDNRLENLRLVDAKGNATNRDYYYGQENPAAKLTDLEAEEIRALYEAGSTTLREIAEQYDISKSQVHNIVSKHPVRNRVDRLRSLGNAVVPQQIYPILKAIADWETGKALVEGK